MDLRIHEAAPLSQGTKTRKADHAESTEFAFTLNRLGDENLSARLGALINDITAQGEKIAKHMDVRDLRAYRALISDFINEIITNSYKFKRENFLNRRGLHKVYSMVSVVNKELDDLAQELLKDEKDHIAILDKTGEIQGLLLDLLV